MSALQGIYNHTQFYLVYQCHLSIFRGDFYLIGEMCLFCVQILPFKTCANLSFGLSSVLGIRVLPQKSGYNCGFMRRGRWLFSLLLLLNPPIQFRLWNAKYNSDCSVAVVWWWRRQRQSGYVRGFILGFCAWSPISFPFRILQVPKCRQRTGFQPHHLFAVTWSHVKPVLYVCELIIRIVL